MTRFELPDAELHHTVEEVIGLYDQAQSSVFKLMASVSASPHPVSWNALDTRLTVNQDSVPKFLRDPNYHQALLEYNAKTAGGTADGPTVPLPAPAGRNVTAVAS